MDLEDLLDDAFDDLLTISKKAKDTQLLHKEANESSYDKRNEILTRIQESISQESLQEEPKSDDADKSILENVLLKELLGEKAGVDEDGLDDGMIEKFVSSLLSKDMLYEPLRDLYESYPAFLEDSTLETPLLENYKLQYGHLKELIALWDSGENNQVTGENGDNNTKAWDLLQKIEACGPPPEQLLPKQ